MAVVFFRDDFLLPYLPTRKERRGLMNQMPLPTRAEADSRIHFLDFLRIFAFLSVLVGHKFEAQLAALGSDPSVHISLRSLAQGLLPLCHGGAAGVVVFFLVSGYIILHVLQVETTSDFVVKRIFRIYPLYVFAVLVECACSWVGGGSVPSLAVLVPRLMLLGDLFSTPYGLAGVEWTLRIEIMFYALMAVFKYIGLLRKPFWLLGIFVGITVALASTHPHPVFAGWSDGYINLYTPFLFMGSIIYLAEKRLVSGKLCALAIAAMFMLFWLAAARMQPNWKESNYAIYAVAIFLLAWVFRTRLVTGGLSRLLSELTFSIYLFHNWLWAYLVKFVTLLQLPSSLQPVIVMASLFLICYAAHLGVEKTGVRLGRRVLRRIKQLLARHDSQVIPAAAAANLVATPTRE